jgi:hypothetical protein
MKINVLHISFTPLDLQCLTEEERIFFLQVGGFLQEIISLQKFMHMCSRGVPDKWQRAAENAQAMYFCRLLAGTLFEAWNTLHSHKYRAVLAKYRPKLRPEAQGAETRLNEYFSRPSNLCAKIRNNYSHHSNYGEIRKALRSWPENEKLDLILSDTHANCRYLAVDVLMNHRVCGSIYNMESISSFLQEVMNVVAEFVTFGSEYISHILKRLATSKDGVAAEEEINDVPQLNDLRLHYFVADEE